MKECPIIFNDEMVRAILEGRKTQTRRIVKGHIGATGQVAQWLYGKKILRGGLVEVLQTMAFHHCPFGQPGDRLWVRECWAWPAREHKIAWYRAAGLGSAWGSEIRWRPSIHMPRWASRITLEVTGVRVERLQDISEEDARAEGVHGEREAAAAGLGWYDRPRKAFASLWQSIYGADSWESNPWVWVVEFRRLACQA